jgi:hypothetical protein
VFCEQGVRVSPCVFTSEFNHVFIIVRDEGKIDSTRRYRVAIATKRDVPPFSPVLRDEPIFTHEELRIWLLSKMINAERACLSAPVFAHKLHESRERVLGEVVKETSAKLRTPKLSGQPKQRRK